MAFQLTDTENPTAHAPNLLDVSPPGGDSTELGAVGKQRGLTQRRGYFGQRGALNKSGC